LGAATLYCVAAASIFAAGEPPENRHFHFEDLLPRSLQTNPRQEFTVLTEVTPEGKKRAAASREAPEYYVGADGGLVESGDPVAGERPPAAGVLAKTLQQALAQNGYLAANAGHAPTLFIQYRWGSYNQIGISMNADGTQDEHQMTNFIERCAIVGGTKFAIDVMRAYRTTGSIEHFRRLNDDNDQLISRAEANLYFVIASAYDFAAAQRGEKKLLWRTRMSTTSHGLTMQESLPSIVRLAGPYFGRDMAAPSVLTPRLSGGRVEVGPATVKEYLTDPPPSRSKR
jgi:hypothetical protein